MLPQDLKPSFPDIFDKNRTDENPFAYNEGAEIVRNI
jgi:hypothetical protein